MTKWDKRGNYVGHLEFPQFPEWVREHQDELAGLAIDKVTRLGDNPFACDYYIRFEHLEDDVRMIIKQLDLTSPSTPLDQYKMAPKATTYHAHYDRESRETIARIFKADIERFQYKY